MMVNLQHVLYVAPLIIGRKHAQKKLKNTIVIKKHILYHSEQAEYTLMATTDEKLNNMSLLGETVGCIVLDSGTKSIVGGLAWFECFF